MPTPAGDRFLGALNNSQRKICTLLVEEERNKSIAWKLGTSEQVVKNYLRHMFNLAGVDTRLGFALWMIRNGVLPCPCGRDDGKNIP